MTRLCKVTSGPRLSSGRNLVRFEGRLHPRRRLRHVILDELCLYDCPSIWKDRRSGPI